MSAERESGFYWVRAGKDSPWIVAQLIGSWLFMPGSTRSFSILIYEIGPRIEPPAENKNNEQTD